MIVHFLLCLKIEVDLLNILGGLVPKEIPFRLFLILFGKISQGVGRVGYMS